MTGRDILIDKIIVECKMGLYLTKFAYKNK